MIELRYGTGGGWTKVPANYLNPEFRAKVEALLTNPYVETITVHYENGLHTDFRSVKDA